MKKIIPLLLLFTVLACEDDEPLPQTNRYFKLTEITSLPALAYDPDGSPPDVRVDLKRRSSNFWEFSTETENNAALPTFLVFPAEILATDELYEIRIVDEDLNQPDDYEIFFWTFHAFDEGEDGEITFFDGNQRVMTLNFNVK